MNVVGKIVVVTGGNSGIGKACIEILKQQGAIAVAWDLSITENNKARYHCDVRDEDSVKKALEATIAELGMPSVCIQCAGIAPAQRMVGRDGPMPLDFFKKVIDINLVGTFNVMRLISAAMIEHLQTEQDGERGVFINTASVAAYEGQMGQTAYSASKGGVVSLTLPAARELAQHGIRVNTIAPGLIETPMLLGMPEPVQESLKASVPFPKRFGLPLEYAKLALHIIDNVLINGEVIRLDGALRMMPR